MDAALTTPELQQERPAAFHAAQGYALYDKHGIPILPGDTVKVFHYVAAVRREKRYMYKFVLAVENRAEGKPPLMKLSHLNLKDEWYWELMDGRRMEHYEIVQGFGGVPSGDDYRDRERQKHNGPDQRPPT